MYATNIADLNTTNDFDNISDYNNCTNNESNIDVIIPTLILRKPCGLSFLCFMSLMVYTFIRPLIKKWWRNFYTQIIQFDVL